MAVKTTRQVSKEPDLLQLQLQKVIDIISRHKSKAYLLLALHIIGLILAAGWHIYKISYEKSAQIAYQKVESRFKNDALAEKFSIIEGFKKVASDYPRSNASLQAYFRMGSMYFNANQIDLSMKSYDHLIKNVSKDNYLLGLALMGKGYCLEAKNDFQNALLSFESALKSRHGNLLQALIYRDIGRVYGEMKDNKQSLNYYRKSLEQTTDPTMEIMIKRKISFLN